MAYTNFKDLITATCNSIRSKDKTTLPIATQDIPQRILDIPSGGGGECGTIPVDFVYIEPTTGIQKHDRIFVVKGTKSSDIPRPNLPNIVEEISGVCPRLKKVRWIKETREDIVNVYWNDGVEYVLDIEEPSGSGTILMKVKYVPDVTNPTINGIASFEYDGTGTVTAELLNSDFTLDTNLIADQSKISYTYSGEKWIKIKYSGANNFNIKKYEEFKGIQKIYFSQQDKCGGHKYFNNCPDLQEIHTTNSIIIQHNESYNSLDDLFNNLPRLKYLVIDLSDIQGGHSSVSSLVDNCANLKVLVMECVTTGGISDAGSDMIQLCHKLDYLCFTGDISGFTLENLNSVKAISVYINKDIEQVLFQYMPSLKILWCQTGKMNYRMSYMSGLMSLDTIPEDNLDTQVNSSGMGLIFTYCPCLERIKLNFGIPNFMYQFTTGSNSIKEYDFSNLEDIMVWDGYVDEYFLGTCNDTVIKVKASLLDAWKISVGWQKYAKYMIGV